MVKQQENRSEKSVFRIMRSLHRDVGLLLVGLTLVYCLSGVVLVYRDQGFLKSPQLVDKSLPAGLGAGDLGRVLHLRDFKVEKQEAGVIYFKEGSYDSATGQAKYLAQTYPSWLSGLNGLHMLSSRSGVHLVAVVYGVLLMFLALSSFWMYRPGTRHFRRGVLLAGIGIVFALVIVIFGPTPGGPGGH